MDFIIKFKNSEKTYIVPTDKLNRFPNSYFMSTMSFNKKPECELDICTYDNFLEIYNYILNGVIDMNIYISNYDLIDYLGIKHPILDSLIKMANLKYKTIDNFINKNKFLLVDSLDEYVTYKEMFRDTKHIIPFQYIMMDQDRTYNDYPKRMHDILLCGNGQLCDIGEIRSHRRNGIIEQKNYLKNIIDTANKNQKNIPLGLPFDWLYGTEMYRLIDFFNPSGKYIQANREKYNFSKHDFDCISNMNESFVNEIAYIINGINLVCKRHLNVRKLYENHKTFKKNEHFIAVRKNEQLLNSYLDIYNTKFNIEYGATKNLAFNNFSIRKDIYNSKNKPVIYDKITNKINDEEDGNEKYSLFIEVYFGFVNTNLDSQ